MTTNTFLHSEFVYTGTHPAGRNSNNGGQAAFVDSWGLALDADDRDYAIYNLERSTGEWSLRVRGRTVRYAVQHHRGKSDQFGYEWAASYRLIGID